MRIIAKISPSIKLTARLSCNTNVRRYTSLVQVQQRQTHDQQLLWSNLAMRRFYVTNKSDITNRGFVKNDFFNTFPENNTGSILPIALIDLNPRSNNSSKVLLIPLNWHDADEHSMRSTITSIFSKPKNLQQIEAFSQALKDVPCYQKTKENTATKSRAIRNKEETKDLTKDPKKEVNLKEKQVINTSMENLACENLDNMDHLAAAIERSLQQCCLHSMQMFVDDNIIGERIKGLNLLSVPSKIRGGNIINDIELSEPLNPICVVKIDASKLNLKDISWNAKIPFPENQIATLTNITIPISFSKKSYSTRTITLPKQKTLTDDKGQDSQMLAILPKSNPKKMPTLNILRKASSSSVSSKCNPNYDFPYLSKLFGTKELLMSCDAYNKALIEAEKRRAALAECTALSKKLPQNSLSNRPQVVNIKGCSDPNLQQTATKISSPCSPPAKPKMQASNGCKKDDPCKPPECPNPCKDELEKLNRLKEEEMKKKRNKMPTGCESPKCKKEDSCTKFRKSPCKKATNHSTNVEMKSTMKSPDNVKQMTSSCKKDDPCKPSESPNPCKNEMEKLNRLKGEEMKRNRNKIPTGCVSPKCKKEDSCIKPKESPCKKANASDGSLKCDKKPSTNKGKSDSCGKSKDKKQKNPCLDDHTEYKPKCNKDPCKEGGSPCGGAKKKADSSGDGGKKEDPCEKYNIKKDPCKMKDICGGNNKKDDPCKKQNNNPCGSKKEDPCKTRKSSPCGSRKEDPCKKQKDDPCKKKNEDPCKKPKEDPCKKKNNSPCGSKKDDPCKKTKDDPCKKQKDDPCKKKKDSPCSYKKEDPCKKSKDDPCKKKKDSAKSPCGSKKEDPCKKKPTSPCKPKKDTKSKCQKTSNSKKKGCGKPKKETKPKCEQNKKCFSTSALENNNLIMRTFSNFSAMPSIKNRNWVNFNFKRYYSSKRDGNKKNTDDLGRASQCKSVETKVPPKRKPAYNPHPKDGLRKCYPTYDMDCQQFCKDARKTDCRKYAFLKDTDNNKRNDF
ncbi:Cornifin-B [Lucilia cuprina]|nr:Cornifin-B [Lucilia cuprina]